jgi:serine/threonine protein phosphatase PrpC
MAAFHPSHSTHSSLPAASVGDARTALLKRAARATMDDSGAFQRHRRRSRSHRRSEDLK